MLFKKKKSFRYIDYINLKQLIWLIYLLKLLQISLCVCVSLTVGRLQDELLDMVLSHESVWIWSSGAISTD